MTCPRCQHENPAGSNFCLGCGTRLGLQCASCGSDLPPGSRFCNLIEDGLQIPNPAASIGRYLKGKADPRISISPLTPEEEALFLSTARTYCPRYYPMFLCAVR